MYHKWSIWDKITTIWVRIFLECCSVRALSWDQWLFVAGCFCVNRLKNMGFITYTIIEMATWGKWSYGPLLITTIGAHTVAISLYKYIHIYFEQFQYIGHPHWVCFTRHTPLKNNCPSRTEQLQRDTPAMEPWRMRSIQVEGSGCFTTPSFHGHENGLWIEVY